jgi:hypothetical protein
MKILPNLAVNTIPKFFGGKKHPSLFLATYLVSFYLIEVWLLKTPKTSSFLKFSHF